MKQGLSIHSKIYVAGHRGLLGSAVWRKLEQAGYQNLLGMTSAELDLRNQADVFAFLEKEKPEYVFACAAKVGGIYANMSAQGEFLYTNLQIQNNLIEGARRANVTKLLFVASSCIYPKNAASPFREEQILSAPLEPTNEGYAIAKIAGIRMCQFYRQQYGCDFISAIPPNLYGINDNYDLQTSHFLPAMIRKVHEAKLRACKEIEVWGTGRPRREFMLSDDCADALVFLMKNYSDELPINVGVGHDRTIREITEIIAQTVGFQADIKLDATKPDGVYQKLLDVSRLQKLGWKPNYSLAEGVAVAYKDFLRNGIA